MYAGAVIHGRPTSTTGRAQIAPFAAACNTAGIQHYVGRSAEFVTADADITDQAA
jgi:hypothetical protein